jgi:HSP20 family molecular chaperone IbpA
MSLFTTLNPLSRPEAPATEAQAGSGPTLRPVYEVKETADAFGLTVYLPGVPKDGLEITAENDQIRILGNRTWRQPEGWTVLYRETSGIPFELVLRHDNAVDPGKIHAELRDGVLRASLPKAEGVKPRRIEVS